MKIVFLGYVTIGAIIGLICEVWLGVKRYKVGYSLIEKGLFSIKLPYLIGIYLIDLFTWPERLLSLGWYLIFKDIIPYRKWWFNKMYGEDIW